MVEVACSNQSRVGVPRNRCQWSAKSFQHLARVGLDLAAILSVYAELLQSDALRIEHAEDIVVRLD